MIAKDRRADASAGTVDDRRQAVIPREQLAMFTASAVPVLLMYTCEQVGKISPAAGGGRTNKHNNSIAEKAHSLVLSIVCGLFLAVDWTSGQVRAALDRSQAVLALFEVGFGETWAVPGQGLDPAGFRPGSTTSGLGSTNTGSTSTGPELCCVELDSASSRSEPPLFPRRSPPGWAASAPPRCLGPPRLGYGGDAWGRPRAFCDAVARRTRAEAALGRRAWLQLPALGHPPGSHAPVLGLVRLSSVAVSVMGAASFGCAFGGSRIPWAEGRPLGASPGPWGAKHSAHPSLRRVPPTDAPRARLRQRF